MPRHRPEDPALVLVLFARTALVVFGGLIAALVVTGAARAVAEGQPVVDMLGGWMPLSYAAFAITPVTPLARRLWLALPLAGCAAITPVMIWSGVGRRVEGPKDLLAAMTIATLMTAPLVAQSLLIARQWRRARHEDLQHA